MMTVLASYPELTDGRPVAPTRDALGVLRHTEVPTTTGDVWSRRQHLSGAPAVHHSRAGGPWRLTLRDMVALTPPSRSRALIASETPALAAAGS